MSAGVSSARKMLPKRLEEDLENVPKYKAKMMPPKPRSVSELMSDSAERAMFDEVFGSVRPPSSGSKADILLSQMRSQNQNKPNGISSSSTCSSGLGVKSISLDNEGDFDMPGSSRSTAASSSFETSVLSRLLLVEEEAKRIRQQLAVAQKEVLMLTSENDLLKRQSQDQSYMITRSNDLSDENRALKKQIKEMEQFLDDYGLVWVGNGNDGAAEVGVIPAADMKDDRSKYEHKRGEIADSSNPDSSGSGNAASPKEEMTVSYKVFAKQIAELNSLLDSEGIRFVAQDNKAKLLHPKEFLDNIKVTFYKDGLMINNGPFRFASNPLCISFVRDIIDGFFPSEFKSEHPEGVYIELVDRHTNYYNPRSEPKLTRDGLLERLPKQVIKNGQVINLRESVGDLLTSKITTPVVVTAEVEDEASIESPCKINVKWSEGNKQGVVTISKFSTVLQLRNKIKLLFYVEAAVVEEEAGGDSKGETKLKSDVMIELRTSFPSQILEDSMTIEAAGLFPKGSVHARLIR